MSQYYLEDFVEQSNAAQTRDEVFTLYMQILGKFGFDRAVYTFVTDIPSLNQKAGHGVQCNFPDNWMEYYNAKNYEKIDPVILQVLKSASTFTWKQLIDNKYFKKEQLSILEEGNEAGLHDGIGIPLYCAAGGLAGVGLASSIGGINPDKNMLSKIRLATEQFHLTYCSLVNSKQDNNLPTLTEKEIEVLKWLAIGKPAEEIAIIMNCKKVTAKFHITNIYTKLQANTRILAVTKAIRLGLVPLDTIKV